jgi:dynein heavy chain, axonemal
LAEQRRHYYVTPTSYLELLLSYRTLLTSRQNEVMTVKKRYEVGLEKLETTESSVGRMQEELIALQPQLVQSTLDTEAAMVVIAKESEEADVVKEVGCGCLQAAGYECGLLACERNLLILHSESRCTW